MRCRARRRRRGARPTCSPRWDTALAAPLPKLSSTTSPGTAADGELRTLAHHLADMALLDLPVRRALPAVRRGGVGDRPGEDGHGRLHAVVERGEGQGDV